MSEDPLFVWIEPKGKHAGKVFEVAVYANRIELTQRLARTRWAGRVVKSTVISARQVQGFKPGPDAGRRLPRVIKLIVDGKTITLLVSRDEADEAIRAVSSILA